MDHDDVPFAETRRGHVLGATVGSNAIGHRFGARLPKRVRLGLAPALGHRLSEVGEQHGEPQPERDLPREQRPPRSVDQLLDEDHRGEQAARLDDEHHRVLDLNPRVELAERIQCRLPDDAGIPNGQLACAFRHDGLAFLVARGARRLHLPRARFTFLSRARGPTPAHLSSASPRAVSVAYLPAGPPGSARFAPNVSSSARFSSSTLTLARPRNPSVGGSVCARIRSRTRATSTPRADATRGAWISAAAGGMCGSMPPPLAVTISDGTCAGVTPSCFVSASSRSLTAFRWSGFDGP